MATGVRTCLAWWVGGPASPRPCLAWPLMSGRVKRAAIPTPELTDISPPGSWTSGGPPRGSPAPGPHSGVPAAGPGLPLGSDGAGRDKDPAKERCRCLRPVGHRADHPWDGRRTGFPGRLGPRVPCTCPVRADGPARAPDTATGGYLHSHLDGACRTGHGSTTAADYVPCHSAAAIADPRRSPSLRSSAPARYDATRTRHTPPARPAVHADSAGSDPTGCAVQATGDRVRRAVVPGRGGFLGRARHGSARIRSPGAGARPQGPAPRRTAKRNGSGPASWGSEELPVRSVL